MGGEHIDKESLGSRSVSKAALVTDVLPVHERRAGRTGASVIDEGSACRGRSSDDCFLSDADRKLLITQVQFRVLHAGMQYEAALAELGVEKLIEKDDDLPWVVSLVLDVAGAHVIGTVLSALKRARSKGLDQLLETQLQAVMRGEDLDPNRMARVESALHGLTDKRIDAGVKPALDAAKKAVVGELKSSSNASATDEKRETLSYLAQLQRDASIGFATLREQGPVGKSDAELVVMYAGFDIRYHLKEMYKATLAEKLKRYHASGVTSIGRRNAVRRERPDGAPFDLKSDVVRDTRVVWVTYRSGEPMELVYEQHEGDRGSPDVIRRGDPGFPLPSKISYGPRSPITKHPELGRPVPREFWEAAAARHTAVWGAPPAAMIVEDRSPWDRSLRSASKPRDEARDASDDAEPVAIPPALVLEPSVHDE